jgi:hypothetical protein
MKKVLPAGLMALLASAVFLCGAVEASGNSGPVSFKGSTNKTLVTSKSTTSTINTGKTGGSTTVTPSKVTFTPTKTKHVDTDWKKIGNNGPQVGKTDHYKKTYDQYGKSGKGWCGWGCGWWGCGWGCGWYGCCHPCVPSCGCIFGGCCTVVIIEVCPDYGVLPPPEGPPTDGDAVPPGDSTPLPM